MAPPTPPTTPPMIDLELDERPELPPPPLPLLSEGAIVEVAKPVVDATRASEVRVELIV